MSADTTLNKGVTTSVWFLYCVIVFEILFMISPFAFYYYSIYAVPLNALQEIPALAWLTLHIFPHFTWHGSGLANFLIISSWPMIFIGVIMFLVAFFQIYWAKFTGKGAVAVGLYKHIRHPQYVALALIGLGTTIFWSRFIVLAMFATMLYLYYFLAAHEERLCLAKFGDSYARYLETTGRFLPRRWTAWLPAWRLPMPASRPAHAFAHAFIYIVFISLIMTLGWSMKHHVLAQLTVKANDDTAMIALAPTDNVDAVFSALVSDPRFHQAKQNHGLGKVLCYLAPASWSVPELGLSGEGGHDQHSIEELLHPTIHGNSLNFDGDNWQVLVTAPKLADDAATGQDILHSTLSYELALLIHIEAGRIVSITESPNESRWKGIPVPVF